MTYKGGPYKNKAGVHKDPGNKDMCNLQNLKNYVQLKDSKTYKKQKFTNVIKNLQGIKIANKNALYQTFEIT